MRPRLLLRRCLFLLLQLLHLFPALVLALELLRVLSVCVAGCRAAGLAPAWVAAGRMVLVRSSALRGTLPRVAGRCAGVAAVDFVRELVERGQWVVVVELPRSAVGIVGEVKHQSPSSPMSLEEHTLAASMFDFSETPSRRHRQGLEEARSAQRTMM